MLPPLMMQTRSGERDINIEETVCSVMDRETMSSNFFVFYDCLSKLRAKCIDPTIQVYSFLIAFKAWLVTEAIAFPSALAI